jgi:hypothetical protein
MSEDIRRMIDKVKNFKQFVNENYNQNKFDIAKLSREFLEIDNEMSELIEKADSLAKDGIGKQAWERYKELEHIRRQKSKDLFIGNNPDEMYDDVHDAILSDIDGVAEMPNGYTATIIASYYNSIMKYYNTIAVVKTPKNIEYLIDVPTYNKIKIGTIFNN